MLTAEQLLKIEKNATDAAFRRQDAPMHPNTVQELVKMARRYQAWRAHPAFQSEIWLMHATPEEIDAGVDELINSQRKEGGEE